MAWLFIIIWAIVVALLCAAAFLMLVGQAFASRQNEARATFINLILGTGIKLGLTHPAALLGAMWAMWTVVGAAVILVLHASSR